MKRILLDTNVYGRLLEDKSFLRDFIMLVPCSFIVYGSSLVRKELRDLSANAKIEGKNKRILLLTIYDSLIRKENHSLHVTDVIILIAHKYFEEYKKNEGNLSLHEMLPDFTLIALASVHALDLVVSDDTRTMVSESAKKAYYTINQKYQFRTPSLYTYNKFKEYVKGV